jgi:hypothetical protein
MLTVSSIRLVKLRRLRDEPAAARTDSPDLQMYRLTPSAAAAAAMPPADPPAAARRQSTPARRRPRSPPLRLRKSVRRPLGSPEIRHNRHSPRRFDEADAQGARGSRRCRTLCNKTKNSTPRLNVHCSSPHLPCRSSRRLKRVKQPSQAVRKQVDAEQESKSPDADVGDSEQDQQTGEQSEGAGDEHHPSIL